MLNFTATKYSLNSNWETFLHLAINIEWRGHDDIGNPLFCVKVNGNVMHRDGSLELEPMPSSRTASFIQNTRFSLAEAQKIANQYVPSILQKHVNQPHVKQFIKTQAHESWAQEIIKNYLT